MILMVLAAAVAAQGQAATPVTETRFGITTTDDDRWMESKANAARLRAWLLERDQAGRAMLAALPKRGALLGHTQRLSQRGAEFRGIRSAGPVTVIQRRWPGDAFSRLFVVRGGRETLLLDPNKGAVRETAGNVSLSPDGSLVALNRYAGGSEAGAIEIWTTGPSPRRLERIETVWGEDRAVWLSNRSYLYNRMSAPGAFADPQFGNLAYRRRVGEAGPGTPLFGVGLAEGFTEPAEAGLVTYLPGARWAIGWASAARSEVSLWLAPAASVRAGMPRWRRAVTLADKVTQAAVLGDKLFTIRPEAGGAVLGMQRIAADGALGPAQVLRRDRPNERLDKLHADASDLYVTTRSATSVGLLHFPAGTGPGRPVALPFASGDLFGIGIDGSGRGLEFGLSGWKRAITAYRVDGGKLRATGYAQPTPPEVASLVVEEGEAASADGTRVPIVVLHGPQRPARGWPTALMAYGGYGIRTITPGVGRDSLPFLIEGGALALCGVRGGGEKGAAWHEAGRGPNKPRGQEDMIACAQWLREQRISTPAGPVAMGASMAGTLVPLAVLKRPDLFSGAILLSMILNPLRIAEAANGANQFDEIGDPRTEAGTRALAAMDAYHALASAPRTVDTLVGIGLNDGRVENWMSGKYVARAERRFPGRTWLRADGEMGHGMGTAAAVQQSEMADVFAFVLDRASR